LSDGLISLDGAEPGPKVVERLIRLVLTTGFLIVLGLEAWLLWRAWGTIF
jgi:hypothetical protein